MNASPAADNPPGRRFSLDFWSVVMGLSVALIGLLLVWPLVLLW